MGWQSIETAPRDGTWIWVYIPPKSIPIKGKGAKAGRKRHGGLQKSVRWADPQQDCFPGGAHLSDHAKALRDEHGGYWSTGGLAPRPTAGAPSHWRELPDPPIRED